MTNIQAKKIENLTMRLPAVRECYSKIMGVDLEMTDEELVTRIREKLGPKLIELELI